MPILLGGTSADYYWVFTDADIIEYEIAKATSVAAFVQYVAANSRKAELISYYLGIVDAMFASINEKATIDADALTVDATEGFSLFSLLGDTIGEIEASMDGKNNIIDMGKPLYKNQILAINDGIDSFGRLLKVEDFHYTIYSLYLGEIYTIVFVDDLNSYICNNGELIAYNKLFKKKTNVCFVKKIDEQNIEVKVFDHINKYNEFNVLALGACALVGKNLRILESNVNVYVDNECVNVKIDRKENVTISGKSTLVYTGNIGDEILC